MRTSWVFSSHGINFAKTILRLSQSQDIIKVVDDQIGGPTHASDIARACVSITKQLIDEPKKSGIYHYSGTPDVSWCEFAKVIIERARRKIIVQGIPTSEYPTPALRHNSRLNCSSIENTFNIRRPYWRDGIEEILKNMEIE